METHTKGNLQKQHMFNNEIEKNKKHTSIQMGIEQRQHICIRTRERNWLCHQEDQQSKLVRLLILSRRLQQLFLLL